VRAFEEAALPEANAAALSLYRRLRALDAPEVEDVVPAAQSVLITLRADTRPSAALRTVLEEPVHPDDTGMKPRAHEIAVSYGGDAGPDLADVAAMHGLSEREVVAVHLAPTYTVGFIGFAPGFPYLLGLDSRLQTPRLDSPRTKVTAGSVGIGGIFTGIYPRSMPGGWRIIGRTESELFDPADLERPALLSPGDRVRFVES
jgi:KipI family sensor histidine kinase inhibitor